MLSVIWAAFVIVTTVYLVPKLFLNREITSKQQICLRSFLLFPTWKVLQLMLTISGLIITIEVNGTL